MARKSLLGDAKNTLLTLLPMYTQFNIHHTYTHIPIHIYTFTYTYFHINLYLFTYTPIPIHMYLFSYPPIPIHMYLFSYKPIPIFRRTLQRPAVHGWHPLHNSVPYYAS